MKEILFVHSSCAVGGIETFFIRLAKELRKKNIIPKFFFLYKGMTDKGLEMQLREFGEVYFWEDFSFSKFIRNDRVKLLAPLSSRKVRKIFGAVDCIHVDTSVTFLIAKRVISCLGVNTKIVFGVYHANELAWSFNKGLPRYESFFRKKVFSSGALFLFFNEFSSNITKNSNNIEGINEKIFPLGVDLPKSTSWSGRSEKLLKIVSIGRLVSFKTYNLFMPKVIKKLVDEGVEVSYDVYGDGPLLSQLVASAEAEGLSRHINYHGALEYGKIDCTLREYDLFLGSGTAVLHAAANGVPSVVAIENEPNHVSYGFFSDIPGIDYHEQQLPYDRLDIVGLIKSFNEAPLSQRKKLSSKHIEKASAFDINSCAVNFDEAFLSSTPQRGESIGFYYFMCWFFVAEAFSFLTGGERYSSKYNQNLKKQNAG